MGHICEYRNGFFSTALIENADFAESLNMIGVIASPSAMWVLNNKSYSSSQRYYHFVKYDLSVKSHCRDLGGDLSKKLTRKSNLYTNTDDKEVNEYKSIRIMKRLKENGRKLENLFILYQKSQMRIFFFK